MDTRDGQVHYRTAGTGQPVVLLHWGPGTGSQYIGVLQALAKQGCCGIAPDLPGFGASFRRDGVWSIAKFAENLAECFAAWQLNACVLVGGHLAALIALETARTTADFVELLVLDGTPVWDAETRQKIVQSALPDSPVPVEDGSHLVSLWKHLLWEIETWRPNQPFDSALGEFAMNLLKARFLADFDTSPGKALVEYDAETALRELRIPTLALTATDDPLNNCHPRVLELVPRARQHCFEGDHPIHSWARGGEYVAPILDQLSALKEAGRRAER